jgi:hypothetical protein
MEDEVDGKSIIYSLSDLTDRSINIYSELRETSFESWIEHLGEGITTFLATLNDAASASEMFGPNITAEDDLTVDTSQANEGFDFLNNPFLLAVREMGPRLAAFMIIEAIDHRTLKDRGAAHMEAVAQSLRRFLEANHEQYGLTVEQAKRLIQAHAAVWPTIDADYAVWKIVSRYIKAKDADIEAEMVAIRAEVAPPVKRDFMRCAIDGKADGVDDGEGNRKCL